MYVDLGPANHHASICMSRVRWLSPRMRELLRKEGVWDDLRQELYAAAWYAWKQGMDDIETRRYAARHLYACLKAYGFRLCRRGYVKVEIPFERAFKYNILDRGLAPRDPLPMPLFWEKDDHLDEKIMALLMTHPEGLTRSKLSANFQIPVTEVGHYLSLMIKKGEVIEIKRENTRGRPRGPLLLIAGAEIPEEKMVKTERDERIRQAYFVGGKSIKQIARESHHDKRVVRRAIQRKLLWEKRPPAAPVLGPPVLKISGQKGGETDGYAGRQTQRRTGVAEARSGA